MNIIKLYFNHKKITILIPIVVSILVAGFTLLMPNWYRGTVTLMPSTGGSALGDLASLAGMNIDVFGNSGQHNRIMTILNSRTIKEQMVKKFNLIEKYDVENLEFAIEKFSNNKSIIIGEQMQISISVYDKDQDKVAEMAEYYVHSLDSINNKIYNNSGKNLRSFIGSRITIIEDSIMTTKRQLQNIMEKNDIISLEDQARVAVMQLSEIKSNIIMKEIELEMTKNGLLNNNLNPAVKLQLNALQDEYDYIINNKKNTDQLNINLKEIPKIGINIESLKAKLLYYEKIIEFLGPQYEKAKIDETKNIPTIDVLDYAVRPEKKAKPSRSKIVIATFMFASIISFYWIYFKSLNTEE